MNQSRRHAGWNVAAVLVLVTVAVLVVLRDSPSTSEGVPAAPSAAESTGRSERVLVTLTALENAWETRNRVAFLTGAGRSSRSQAWAGQTYDALVSLDADVIELRYVDQLGTNADVEVPGEFAADVAVTWQQESPTAPEYRTASATVRMRLADSGEHVVVLGLDPDAPTASRDGAPLPLWLAGELVRAGTPQARCLGIDTDPREIHCGRLARVALRELAAVLPIDVRPLLIVLPATVDQAAAVLGRSPVTLTQIAGVASTIDATGVSDAPQLVVLNPERFVPLGGDDRQLVVTHESVHVATGSPAVVMPVWVGEGFADYVALRSSRIPLAQAAGKALDRVRRVGPPRSLPRDADFDSARSRLTEAYQQAWLVFRLLGNRYGPDAVTAFYTDVLDGARVGPALEEAMGITRAELTVHWRHELERQASERRASELRASPLRRAARHATGRRGSPS